MYKEKIIDVTTGEITFRDFTPEEIAKVEEAQALNELRLIEEQKRAADRLALLSRLGITEEEAKLLLG